MPGPYSPLGDRIGNLLRVEEGEDRDLTYAEFLNDVQRLASALKAQQLSREVKEIKEAT